MKILKYLLMIITAPSTFGVDAFCSWLCTGLISFSVFGASSTKHGNCSAWRGCIFPRRRSGVGFAGYGIFD